MSKAKLERETQRDVAVDPRILKSLGHPLRQRILAILNDKVASPSQLAEELDTPLGTVAYHVNVLLETDSVELVEQKPVRGAVEHFYRATMRPYLDDAHWARLPASSRRALFDQTLQHIWNEVGLSSRQKGLDDLRTHISMTRLELDDEAYNELSDHLTETIELALSLEADSRQRLSGLSDEERETHVTQLVLMHFHRAPERPSGRGPRKRIRRARSKR